MNEKYIFYIAKLINIYGMCAEHTLAMQQKFPELVRIRGHYDCPFHGKICHWWLVAPNGEIVDPTVSQFITKGCGQNTFRGMKKKMSRLENVYSVENLFIKIIISVLMCAWKRHQLFIIL